MSTTVTYKGSTLATVNNNTKTLKTAGKYMEGDVVLTDVSGGTAAISVVDTTDSHGGTIREITALDISDTTAVASDVAQGKYFYTSAGVKTAGTATGGGGSGGSVTWETIYDSNVTIVMDSPNYVVINNWAPTHPTLAEGQTWRVTWNGTEYICDIEVGTDANQTIYIGNAQIPGASDTSNEPFFAYMRTSTQLAFITTDSAGSIALKMELQESGPTHHTIYFEFTDNTDTTINAWYDDSFISDAITATTPMTYNNKYVTLAELDGAAWYEPTNIPLNIELVDLTKMTNDIAIQNDGSIETAQYYSITDYIPINSNMTFSFKCGRWQNCAYYDASRTFISTWNAYSAGASADPNDSNVAIGTLGGNGFTIPSNAAYIRLPATESPSDNSGISLIRTA